MDRLLHGLSRAVWWPLHHKAEIVILWVIAWASTYHYLQRERDKHDH